MIQYIGRFIADNRKFSIRISANSLTAALNALTEYISVTTSDGRVLSIRRVDGQ